ncbi:MAG: copper resistance protein B, partial [Psychrobacter celer]
MKTIKKSLPFIGLSSAVLLTSPLAAAAEMDMSDMDHSGMDMTDDMADMDHGDMDMSGMQGGDMDMSGMQGGEPPADARSPDYSNGVGYGEYGKPVMMGSLPTWGISVDDLGYQFEDDQINFEIEGWYGDDSSRLRLRTEGHA